MSDQPQYPKYPGPEQPPQQPPATPDYGQAPPPPPPGYNPPPPGYGQAPPPGYAAPIGYPPQQSAPVGEYASWISRVAAVIIDGILGLIVAVPMFLGFVVFGSTAATSTDADGFTVIEDGGDPIGWVLIGLGALLMFAFAVWNYVFRQGRKGSTVGKSALGIKVVKEATGQPMGAGLALGRYLLSSLLTSLTCYLNLLWPLWDDKNQALHDKVVSTVVIKAN